MRTPRAMTLLGALAVASIALTGCSAAGNASDGADGDETYDVYALLPQGTDQPYGTTYLPAFEAKADELGLNLTITNSQYDAETQTPSTGVRKPPSGRNSRRAAPVALALDRPS